MFDADRNLLAGVLGLQMELISESQLIAAMQAWIFKKSKKLEEILVDLSFIDVEKCQFLSGLVAQHIKLHKNDPAKCLASLSSLGPVQKQLRDLEDKDVDQTITRLANSREKQETVVDFSTQPTASMRATDLGGDSRFRILRPHAKGGLGQVSLAEDRELHREVALKEIQSAYATDPASRNRFLIEAEVTGQLEHPGIVPVYSLGTTSKGCPFYVMRFIKGASLKEAVDSLYSEKDRTSPEDFRLSLRRLVRRLIDVCNAIEYAHSRGVLHRDLKPGNIMLGKYGETLVVDWGLAKTGTKAATHQSSEERTFVPLSSDASTATHFGSVVGTLSYMSPEQAEGRQDDLGPTSDVYSLGATLYYVLTQEPPVPKLPMREMVERVRTGQIRPPKEINPFIPASLEAICLKAMACRQLDRYKTTAALADDLELWLADEQVSAYQEPIHDRVARFVRRHRTLVTSAMAILLTAVGALLILNSLVRRQNAVLEVARDEADKRRAEADEQRQLAEKSTLEAIQQTERAELNLATARDLSVVLLSTAEKALTSPVIDGTSIHELRKKLTEQAYRNFEKIYDSNPGNPDIAFEFAQVVRISSNLKRFERDLQTANERIQTSLQLQLQVPTDRRTQKQKDYLAETYREIGTLRKGEGKLADAEEALNQALVIAEELLSANLESSLYLRTKATIELEQIQLYAERMELEAALRKSQISSDAFQRLRTSDQASDNDAFLFLFAMSRQIKLLHQLGRHSEAQQVAELAISEGHLIKSKRPDDANVALPFARILYWSAEGIAASKGPTDLEVTNIGEALSILEGLVSKSPKSSYIYGLGEALRIQGMILRKQMKLSEAEAAAAKSREWLEKLIKAANTADNKDVLARTLGESASIKIAASDKSAAMELLTLAISMQSEACKQSPDSIEMNRFHETLAKDLQSLE